MKNERGQGIGLEYGSEIYPGRTSRTDRKGLGRRWDLGGTEVFDFLATDLNWYRMSSSK